MKFTVPAVTTCLNQGASQVSVYAALTRAPRDPNYDPTAAIGIEISCDSTQATPQYLAFWQLDTDSSQGRQYLNPRLARNPRDPSFLVKPGEELIATVRQRAEPEPSTVLSLTNASGSQHFKVGLDKPGIQENIADCWVDHGQGNDSLAKFGKIKVSSCSAGPVQGTDYGNGYLAVPKSSDLSVTHKWGWVVTKSNMVAIRVLASTSNPLPVTNPATGSFVVVWKAARGPV